MHTPMTLKSTWAAQACLAVRSVPMEARTAVMVVPILSPKMMGMAAWRGKRPCTPRAMVRPTVAALDWTRRVSSVPARTPMSGLWLNMRNNSFSFRRKLMEDSMVCIPTKSRPKPNRPLPAYFCTLERPKKERSTPIIMKR